MSRDRPERRYALWRLAAVILLGAALRFHALEPGNQRAAEAVGDLEP